MTGSYEILPQPLCNIKGTSEVSMHKSIYGLHHIRLSFILSLEPRVNKIISAHYLHVKMQLDKGSCQVTWISGANYMIFVSAAMYEPKDRQV